MTSSRKLLLGAVVLLGAVLAALPFRKQMLEPGGAHHQRQSQVRWRDNLASVPAPLEVAQGESLAESLYPPFADRQPEDNNRVTRAVAIGKAVAPPRLAADYEPLLQPVATSTPAIKVEGNAPPGSVPPPNEKGDQETNVKIVTHRIRDGDTLQALAARYLGDPNRYREIYEANRNRLPSEEVLPLNQLIEIYVPRQSRTR